MKTPYTVKKWQLIRYRAREAAIDLREADFVAVGKRAIYKHRTAEEIILPASASAIKTEAFARCKRLASVTLSDAGNTGLSRGVFRGCARLREVKNAEKLSRVGDFAFDGCRNLPMIPMGRDLRKIGEYAFRGCESFDRMNLPSSIELMGRGAFFGCTELKSVAMEEGLSVLGRDAFRECISLEEIVFSHELREIPSGAFRACASLTELVIPSQITTIGSRAFASCARLSDVRIELGTTVIGAQAFADTPRLKTVFLPRSVKRLKLGAFGFGTCPDDEKIVISVDNEYMKRRVQRQLWLCLSFGRARVVVVGKTIEERRRERHRSTLEQTPVHLIGEDLGEREDLGRGGAS